MRPALFDIIESAAGVTALLGTSPVRFYPFGEAPQTVVDPYAVWQTAYGTPENYLNQVPDVDSFGAQIDVYGHTAASVRQVAEAMRDALEPHGHIVSWRGESRDHETQRYRYSFDIELFTDR